MGIADGTGVPIGWITSGGHNPECLGISDFMQTRTLEEMLKELDGKLVVRTVPQKQPAKPGVMLSDQRGIEKAQNALGQLKKAPATLAPARGAKPALSGFETLAGHDHRPGLWGAVNYD